MSDEQDPQAPVPDSGAAPTANIKGIADDDTAFVSIREDTAIAVDRINGEIVGAHAEGTLGIVIYGGDEKSRKGDRFEIARAVRIPRLLQSDKLLNFHVAEITYHESRQAARFDGKAFLLGATGFYRLENPNPFTRMPDTNEGECFIGLYLSPLAHYQLCLVSRTNAWPSRFRDYLDLNKITPKQLFENIQKEAQSSNETYFSKLLFLPDRPNPKEHPSESPIYLRVLDRSSLDSDRARRDVGGWWFNLPVAIYPWMSANLERLLAAYLEDGVKDRSQEQPLDLRSWKLPAWFYLLKHLAQGLKTLHGEGAIHGDARPANIMTNIGPPGELVPESFRWIDIGLGYGARDASGPPLDDQTTLTPRPLGGGRSTVFYAPEREEAKEFEDADVISLIPDKRNPKQSILTFYWRKETHTREVTLLPLKRNDTPLRDLGELKKGDRVQVREFLFEVEEVRANDIVVSGIYEIFLDRVLVEKRDNQREAVRRRLNLASISRYRIFKQWSQATDVYGLGMIALYLFFNRGLDALRRRPDRISREIGLRGTLYDRADREKIFHELAVLLRNRSFLENILIILQTHNFKDLRSVTAELAKPPERTAEATPDVPNDERQKPQDPDEATSGVILASDTNFGFILLGVNNDRALFTQVIFFCLCCVWRQDEVVNIEERTKFAFKPFSKSRLMLEDKEDQAEPSNEAYKMLELLIDVDVRNADQAAAVVPQSSDAEDDEASGADRSTLGVAREQQLLILRDDLRETDAKLKEAEKRLLRCLSAEGTLEATVTRYETKLKSSKNYFEQISLQAESLSEQVARHRWTTSRGTIISAVENIGAKAKEGASRGPEDQNAGADEAVDDHLKPVN